MNFFQETFTFGQSVLLAISLHGIQVVSVEQRDSHFLISHDLKRISFATCDPTSCLFSFLARFSTPSKGKQHCHTFRLASSLETEEINRIVGTAFQVAYDLQRGGQVTNLSKCKYDSDSDCTSTGFEVQDLLTDLGESEYFSDKTRHKETAYASIQENIHEKDHGNFISDDLKFIPALNQSFLKEDALLALAF